MLRYIPISETNGAKMSDRQWTIAELEAGLQPAVVFTQYVIDCLAEHDITAFSVEYVHILAEIPTMYQSALVIDGYRYGIGVPVADVLNKNYAALWDAIRKEMLGRDLYETLETQDPSPELIAWNDLEPMEQELYSYCAWHVILTALRMKIVAEPTNEQERK